MSDTNPEIPEDEAPQGGEGENEYFDVAET